MNLRKNINKFLSSSNYPNFIVIGAQKCGTSSLHYYLDQHHQLKGSTKKEIHYYDKLINYGYNDEWYKNNFTKKIWNNQLTFESTPRYIYVENIPNEIYKRKKDTKFIVLLRDPISRAFSAYNFYYHFFETKNFNPLLNPDNKFSIVYDVLMKGRSQFPTFKEVIEIELDLIKSKGSIEPSILRRGLYYSQLKNWFSVFDKNQFLILSSKELNKNRLLTLNKIADFLKIDPFNDKSIDISSNKNVKSYNGREIDIEDKKFLEKFYEKHNEELFELIGEKIKW